MQASGIGQMRLLGLGIFLVSLSLLLVELLLTRIFSVVMFHHFSFLAVSLAMLGLGLGGLLVNLLPGVFRRDNLGSIAPWLCIGLAVTLLLAAQVAFSTPIRLESTLDNWWRVALIFVASAVPLTLGGLVVAQILAFHSEHANRLYCFDLLGAGAACLVLAPLVRGLGAPNALFLAAAVAALAGCVLARVPLARNCAAGLIVLLALGAGLNAKAGFFDLGYAKGEKVGPTLAIRWNSFSRVEVRGTSESLEQKQIPESWGFSSRLKARVRELYLLYDADAMTQIVGFDGTLASIDYLLFDVATAAHHARRHEDVLVIGAGGGRDVLAALAGGASHVTGLEINDVTVDLMRSQFRDYTSGLYVDHPQVEILVEDGRSFVRRSNQPYDLIIASLVDTWAASAAGAYALAENSLYTVEAFEDYFDALAPDGMVSFSRWGSLRVVMLAKTALRNRGVSDPGRHIIVVQTDSRLTGRPSLETVLVKKTPLLPGEIAALSSWAREMAFIVAYAPGIDAEPGETSPLEALLGTDEQAQRLLEVAPADLRPTTDNRPFFFDSVPIIWWLANQLGVQSPVFAKQELPLGSVALLTSLVASALFAGLLVLLPLVIGRAGKGASPLTGAGKLRWAGYFAALGLGYIIVEIVLIQRFNLYLGNPAYALAVVLFTMLASSGVGALVASRLESRRAVVGLMVGVCFAVMFVALSLDAFVDLTMSGAIGSRIVAAMLYVAPVGCVMGMPFPTGMRLAGRVSPELVSWAWAVNGGMSVFGSVLAVLISMSIGFSACLLVGVGTYAVGAVMVAGAPCENSS